jgi:serine/threonine protein kinase
MTTDNSIGFDKTMTGDNTPGTYTLSPGQTLGQYKIIRPLGKGGMGEVYEAEHQVLRRSYALKLLPHDFATQSCALERFQREAQVMANLEHPNILKVDDFGETDGRYWLRMELANGVQSGDGKQSVSLQDLADAGDGKIGQEKLADILKQILEGLKYAHDRGAIHRDLKPSNILFSGGVAKMADFGLVRLVGEDWVRSQAQLSVQRSMSIGAERTMPGSGSEPGSSTRSLLGTFEYMSPEQKRGEDATAQSDLYAVGLMAFKLLTGQNPGVKPPTKIDKKLSPVWDNFVEKALEEDASERLSSAADGLALLKSVGQALKASSDRYGQAAAEARQREQETRRREENAARNRPPPPLPTQPQPLPKPGEQRKRFVIAAILVLSLLGFIAIPANFQYRKDARTSLCINNIRNIEHAKEAYAISRNLPQNRLIRWDDINRYLGAGVNELYCPEGDGSTPYKTQQGNPYPYVGDVSGNNAVVCPHVRAYPSHIYKPGAN